MTRLEEEMHSHEVEHEHPIPGSTSFKSLLFYQCNSSGNSNVKLLNCSTIPPKLSDKFRLYMGRDDNKRRFIEGMCCVQQGDELLLISTIHIRPSFYSDSHLESTVVGGLLACSVVGEVCSEQWYLEGKLTGMEMGMIPTQVTTDGKGEIFVVDTANKCVQMFSIDGIYEGVILKEGQHGINTPCHIAWCMKTSSLIVAHEDEDKMHHVAQIKLNI